MKERSRLSHPQLQSAIAISNPYQYRSQIFTATMLRYKLSESERKNYARKLERTYRQYPRCIAR